MDLLFWILARFRTFCILVFSSNRIESWVLRLGFGMRGSFLRMHDLTLAFLVVLYLTHSIGSIGCKRGSRVQMLRQHLS